MTLVYAPRARQDIAEIFDAVALHSPSAAHRIEDAIRLNCERLADFPRSAVATDQPGVRRLPVVRYPYAIFYRVGAVREDVEIVRVVHSSRLKDLHRLPED